MSNFSVVLNFGSMSMVALCTPLALIDDDANKFISYHCLNTVDFAPPLVVKSIRCSEFYVCLARLVFHFSSSADLLIKPYVTKYPTSYRKVLSTYPSVYSHFRENHPSPLKLEPREK